MRRMTVLALVAVLALLGAACGGDDDSGGEDTETDGGSTDDGATTDDGGDDGGTSADGLAGVLGGYGGCLQAQAAFSALISATYSPALAQALEGYNDFVDDFAANVPDEIKDDVELIRDYGAAYSEAMSDFSIADLGDPSKTQEIADATAELDEDYPPEERSEAGQAITEWLTDECPALVG